jgi:hypothetical protein
VVWCERVQQGTKAPQAAGVIHTDFMNGFICAEVMAYADFKEHGSESAVKAAGKYRQEGKNYTVVDGDIMFFKVCRLSSSLLCVSFETKQNDVAHCGHSLPPLGQHRRWSGQEEVNSELPQRGGLTFAAPYPNK